MGNGFDPGMQAKVVKGDEINNKLIMGLWPIGARGWGQWDLL